jgi:TetR/AcrR family transcriptional regulator, fatty acid metabolism regulator protein
MARTRDPSLARERRAQVLDATLTLLETGSWHATSLAAVAAEAGVSKGVVTYWFADKDALLLAAIERYHERYAVQFATIVGTPATADERLDMLLLAALPNAEHVRREVMLQAEVLSYVKTRPEAAAQLAAAYVGFRVATSALVALGTQEGLIHAPSEGLPDMVHALIDGITLRIAADPTADVDALRDQVRVHLHKWFTG